jgi:hypothetical protein
MLWVGILLAYLDSDIALGPINTCQAKCQHTQVMKKTVHCVQ